MSRANFSWSDIAEEEAFARLVAALRALGARFRRRDITSMEDLEQCLTDPNANVIPVYIEPVADGIRVVLGVLEPAR